MADREKVAEDAEGWPQEALAVLTTFVYLGLAAVMIKLGGVLGWIALVVGVLIVPGSLSIARSAWHRRGRLDIRQVVMIVPLVYLTPFLFLAVGAVFVSRE